jgi:hypothetical protein
MAGSTASKKLKESRQGNLCHSEVLPNKCFSAFATFVSFCSKISLLTSVGRSSEQIVRKGKGKLYTDNKKIKCIYINVRREAEIRTQSFKERMPGPKL